MRTYLRVRGNRADEIVGEVVREQPLTIWVNGEKFLTLLRSPIKLEALVVGDLWIEKVIGDPAEITRLDVSAVDGRADVTLDHSVTLPTERILTSGCGGGITFRIDHRLFPRLRATLRVAPETLAFRMKELFAAAVHYRVSRGIHGAALSDGERLLVVAEDVGRHNAVDKVKGEALTRGIPTEGRILLSTGRVSSEMLLKAARMGVPLVASRTSPTEMAVALVELLGERDRHLRGRRPRGQPQPLRRERAPAGGGGHGDTALTGHGPGACSACRRTSSDAPSARPWRRRG